MPPTLQFGIRHLLAVITLVAVLLAIAVDMYWRIAAIDSESFVFVVEGYALVGTIVFTLELAWMQCRHG